MKFTDAKAHFMGQLRANPSGAAPRPRLDTPADLHEWKAEMRGFDAAQLELGLARPADVQARNAAIHARTGARIVRHARYV